MTALVARASDNGDPMSRLPLDGSPSARSITFCDHRSTSDCSEFAKFGPMAAGDKPTISVGSLTDSPEPWSPMPAATPSPNLP